MTDPANQDLLRPLADLCAWLREIPAKAVVVGGVAVSLLSRPRFTRDIDALTILPEELWERALECAIPYGIVTRIEDVIGFARRSRVLLLRHAKSGIDIDVILGALAFEQAAVDNAEERDVGGVSVPLPRVADLMIMKAVAHRPQDMQDIGALLDAYPLMDLEPVRRWVREFGIAAAMSDLLEDFDRLVARRREVP